MRRVVSLWLPSLATDRMRLASNRPVDGWTPPTGSAGSASPDAVPPDMPLVTAAHDGHRQVVAAADRRARALGLTAGMPLARAQAMVPGLAVLPAAPARDAAALRDLAADCLRFAPLAAPDAPDGIWVDATG